MITHSHYYTPSTVLGRKWRIILQLHDLFYASDWFRNGGTKTYSLIFLFENQKQTPMTAQWGMCLSDQVHISLTTTLLASSAPSYLSNSSLALLNCNKCVRNCFVDRHLHFSRFLSPSFPLSVLGTALQKTKPTESSWNPRSASPVKPQYDPAKSLDRGTTETVSLLPRDTCWHHTPCEVPKGALDFYCQA